MRIRLLVLAVVLLSMLQLVSAANITGLDGMAVFIDSSPGDKINYTIWNKSTASFGNNITSLDVGSNVKWTVLRNNPVKDEFLLITQDDNDDVTAQVFNGSSWISQLNVSFDVKSENRRQIDAAYESISGNAIIAYENSKSNDKVFGLRAWNGSSWSSETNITTGLSSEELEWVQVIPSQGNDNAMLVVHNTDEEMYAVLWNGSDVVDNANVSITKTSNSAREHFSFAWESQSHDGFLVYANGSSPGEFAYRTFNSTNNTWSSRLTLLNLNSSANNGIGHVSRLCADPTSDYIGFISQDSNDDINIRIWNGTAVEQSPSPPLEDSSTYQDSDDGSVNLDCAWTASGSKALFAFVDYNSTSDDKISYITYNKSSYSVSDIEAAALTSQMSATGEQITYLDLVPNPVQDDIMAITLDDDHDIRAIRWDGNSFNSTIFVLTRDAECSDTDSQCGSFEWRRHETDLTPPSVSSLTSSPNPANANSTIYLNATITDATSIGAVILQVNFTNGTFTNYSTTSNGSNYYNASVTTDFIGNVTILWFANDTLGNVNNSEKSAFAVRDISSPNVTLLSILPNPVNANSTIYVNATVIDSLQISTVIIQANFTNGSFTNYSTSNISDNYFNSSITTNMIDNITIRWFANDTSGNINNTETSSFSVKIIPDITLPAISITSPENNTNFTSLPIHFNYTALDNTLSMNCSLILDGSINSTNTTTNNTLSSFTITTISDGSYNWSINCTDESLNQNSSATRVFRKITEASSSSSSGSSGGGTASTSSNGVPSGGSSGSSKSSESSSEASSESSAESSQESSGNSVSSVSEEASSSLNLESSPPITGAAVSTPIGVYTGVSMLFLSFLTLIWAILLMRNVAKHKNEVFRPSPQYVDPMKARKIYVKPVDQAPMFVKKIENIPERIVPAPRRMQFSELKGYFPQTLGNTNIYRQVELSPRRTPDVRPQVIATEKKRHEVYSMLNDIGIDTGTRPRPEPRPLIPRRNPLQSSYPKIQRPVQQDMISRLKKAYS